MILTLTQVALGGAFGAMLRYLTNVGVMRLIGFGFPYGTMIVNIVGSFLMGFLVVFLAHKDATRLAPLLMTGFLGGFTTFSAFSLDTLTLWERGDLILALTYIAGSVGLSLVAIVAAVTLFRGVFA
ncbi:MAG: fluoride efflux transporter CrcB [Cypionkella sp.]